MGNIGKTETTWSSDAVTRIQSKETYKKDLQPHRARWIQQKHFVVCLTEEYIYIKSNQGVHNDKEKNQ